MKAQVLSILSESETEMMNPRRTSFQQHEPVVPVVKIWNLCAPLKIIRNPPLSDVTRSGLPSSGQMGVLQVRGANENSPPHTHTHKKPTHSALLRLNAHLAADPPLIWHVSTNH